jgi:hypothetical protein
LAAAGVVDRFRLLLEIADDFRGPLDVFDQVARFTGEKHRLLDVAVEAEGQVSIGGVFLRPEPVGVTTPKKQF